MCVCIYVCIYSFYICIHVSASVHNRNGYAEEFVYVEEMQLLSSVGNWVGNLEKKRERAWDRDVGLMFLRAGRIQEKQCAKS